MGISKENPADKSQLEYFASKTNERKLETTTELEGLLNLLADLNILNQGEKAGYCNEDSASTREVKGITKLEDKQEEAPLYTLSLPMLPPSPSRLYLPPCSTPLVNEHEYSDKSASFVVEDLENSQQPILSETEVEKPSDSSFVEQAYHPESKDTSPQSLLDEYEENIEDLYDAYKRLQILLLEPELAELQGLLDNFTRKLGNLEQQIYQPQELINLLLPVISELINRKSSESKESKESIVNSLVPIIDEVIQAKTQENKNAIANAIAPALAAAISQQIRQSPKEVANAIAPEIAAAIKEQIKQQPEEMVDALYPIIAKVIESKHEEDKESLITAIAPLLPPAIAQQIRNCPQEIAQAIAPEIAAAIREQMKIDRDAIAKSIAPEMGRAIKEQIVIERDAMVDALYPVIGSTIAKYMADAIRSINQKIEKTLSVEGISRKIRAKMQGVSEAEIIFKESIPFTVRAVFLIHKSSGLVISDVQTYGKQRLESEMVAGMLTAIRSFVNDWIAQAGDVSEVDSIDYGNSKIILEVAGYCYLAVVTQGETPQWFIRKMQKTLATIVQKYHREIEYYQGYSAAIPEELHQILEGLVKIGKRSSRSKGFKPPGLVVIGSLILGLIVVPWGYFQYRDAIDRRIEKDAAEALASAPELAFYRLEVDAADGKLELTGRLPNEYLRSKAEQIAKKVVPNQILENKIIAVEVPADPVFVASEVKRVTSTLNRINAIAISSRYADGKVTVEGKVSQIADGQKITQAFKQIPGVKTVTNTVQVQPQAIATRIYFESGSIALKATDKNKILEIKAYLNRYPETSLRIVGYSDTVGYAPENLKLAQSRAETVRTALINQGIDPKRLQALGTPTPPLGVDSNYPLWLSRCVEFQPVVSRTLRK